MTTDRSGGLGRIGGIFALMYGAQLVADHVIQTDPQARDKEQPDGQRACAVHVATLTVTQAVAVAAGCLLARDRLRLRNVAVALAVNAVTHYLIDRRTPLVRLVLALPGDRDRFLLLGKPRPGRDDNACLGTGMYAIDQSLHAGILAVVATIAAGGRHV